MYLKSIEIRGFKSFADKTLLTFTDGITAVVGPNGSGKSNISDAVRWVLGEQKIKSLRGGKMEDVIFSGTEFRKPLGFSEVTLLLDNASGYLPIKYSEVSVTRRLFRSGESEYLINNEKCRLRDIQELFMDTGIGTEGYSLIGQGKIDAILSGKMEDRRSLLEEAAGIVKFKTRKEESEKKLFNTEENIIRVNDILQTYEERIGPLYKQKQKAEQFLDLSKKERKILIYTVLEDLKNLEKEKAENLNLEVEAAKANSELKNQLEMLNLKSEDLEKTYNDNDEKHRNYREEYYLKREKLESFRSSLKLTDHRDKEINDSISKAKDIIEQSLEEIAIKDENLIVDKKDYDETCIKYREIKKSKDLLSEKEKDLYTEIEKNREVQKGFLEENEETILRIDNLNKTLANLNKERDYLEGQVENSDSIINNYMASLDINEKAIKKLSLEKGELENKLKEKEKDINKIRDEYKEKLENLEKEKDIIKSLEYDLNGEKSKKNILENLENQYEGYSRASKSLMVHLKKNQKDVFENTFLVGEVINPEKGFEKALEVSLGYQVSNIITETENDSKNLIDLLRKKSFGRATFFPLNVINGRKTPMPKLKKSKLLGNLYDLTSFDPKFKNIALNLLGRVFVAETLEDAIAASKEMGYRNRIVTLDGDIVNAGGSMTGGSTNKSKSGVFSRKRDLENIEKNISNLIESIKVKFETFKEGEKKVLFLSDKGKKERILLDEIKNELIKINERILSFEKDIKNLEEVIKRSNEDIKKKTINLEDFNRSIEDLEKELKELVNHRERNIKSVEEIKKQREKDYKLFDSLKEDLTEKAITEGRLEEVISAKKSSMERLTSEKESLTLSINKNNKEIEEGKNLLENLKREKESILAAIKELESFLKEREKELDNLEMLDVKLRSSRKELENKIRTLNDEYYDSDKNLFKIKAVIERQEEKEEGLVSIINEKLELTLAEARDENISFENPENLKEDLKKIQNKIRRLGSVNVSAIQEYDEVKTHKDFLTNQIEDLEKAKSELKALIFEMVIRMKSMFNENFKVLNENFNDIFRELFRGGSAKLILGDGDVLEAPIEISVRPPGKKLQNINLLSGGEKVLSAIALTFAILKMKPTPFCILDEIEAALDENNVYRFAEFLSGFSKETQFILITHRKGTMESADVIYGVTMEEKGISKIVSMDLKEEREING
ncbi:MAG: chromosome segregation protein SMC [Clostridium sp.]|nr:chromosome segregation protein SMC [Clostridium sp.]